MSVGVNIKSPYYETTLSTRVTIKSDQLDENILKHMLQNLKNKVENKCNEVGYIVRVHQILEYGEGIIDSDTFMGSVNYNVTYSCYFCSPTIGSEILCKVQKYVEGYLSAINGPIRIGVSLTRSPKDITYNDRKIQYKGKDISPNDIIKVNILTTKISKGETNIILLGELKGIATKIEKEMYDKEINMFVNDEVRDEVYI